MFRYSLRILLRNLVRQKSHVWVNVGGMAVSMACATLIFLYVHHESTYDRHHTHAESTYRLVWQLNEEVTWVPSGAGWDRILQSVPEVEEVVSIDPKWGGEPFIDIEDRSFREDRAKVFRTTPNFASIFQLKFVEGNPDEALRQPGAMVISEKMAEKYFREKSAIGQRLKVNKRDDYLVTGVIRSFPDNAHFKADILYHQAESSSWVWPYTYLRLTPGSDPDQLMTKIDSITRQRNPDRYRAGQRFRLQALTDIHLHSNFDYEIGPNGDLTTVRSLTGIGFMILLMGCVNFINMTTAGASRRIKEVSIKKVLGCKKRRLIGQFLMETQLIAWLSALLAMLLIWLLLPAFNTLSGRNVLFPLSNTLLVTWIMVCTLLIGLLAGIYPALVLAQFRPIMVIKRISTQGKAERMTRSSLVVFQFVIAIFLVAGTLTIIQQVKFLNTRSLGFDKEKVIGALTSGEATIDELNTLKTRWETISRVVKATNAMSLPTRLDNIGYQSIVPEGVTIQDGLQMYTNRVGPDFIETMGLRLLEGRGFSDQMSTDRLGESALINQEAARMLGWTNAVGKQLRVLSLNDTTRLRIIGVIENYNDRSMREAVPPMVFLNEDNRPWYMAVRFKGETSGIIDALQAEWESLFTDKPFDYFFMEKAFEELHHQDHRLGKVLKSFATVAILISGIGLFGLSIFVAESRTKEIGIRKVLGATISQLLALLNGQFIVLVLLALAVATPLYYLIMNGWLQGFAYHVELNWINLLFAFLIALVIALTSAGYQSLKAALLNPVNTLKNE